MTALVILVIVLQVLDGWTTYQAIKTRRGVEANSIVAGLIEKFGLYAGLLIAKGAFVILVGAFQYAGLWVGDYAMAALIVINLGYLVVVINNLRVLYR